MTGVDDIVSINLTEKICTFNCVLLCSPVNSLDQVLSIGVCFPPVLVGIWALDVRENYDETVRSEVLKVGTIHSPFTGGAVHKTDQWEGPITLGN